MKHDGRSIFSRVLFADSSATSVFAASLGAFVFVLIIVFHSTVDHELLLPIFALLICLAASRSRILGLFTAFFAFSTLVASTAPARVVEDALLLFFWSLAFFGILAFVSKLRADHDGLVFQSLRNKEAFESRLKDIEAAARREIEERVAQATHANQMLLENEARLRVFIDQAVDAFFSTDELGTVLSFNPVAESMFGLRAQEIIGRNVEVLFQLPERTSFLEYVCSNLLSHSEKARGTTTGLRGLRPDKSSFPIEVHIREVFFVGKRFFCAIGRDLTERLATEEELRRAKLQSDEASQAKSRFLANMSHEIRTPLGAVLGFTELLLERDMSADEMRHSFLAIKRNGELLAKIVDDILDLSKVEAGHLEIERRYVEIIELVRDLETFAFARTEKKGVSFSIQAVGQLPRKIYTDPHRLKQILLNVINNAIKFTDEGEIKVEMSLVAKSSSSGSYGLSFSVRDTGRGISAEEASKLFQPFVQADSSISRLYGGTGLGLVLSRRLAQALGGDLVLSETAFGVGSVFTCVVDVGALDGVAFADSRDIMRLSQTSERTRVAHSSASREHQKLNGLRILIVDDAPDNRLLISKMLVSDGAEVETAENGLVGLQKALASDFDIIVMDIQMPLLDGYQATAELRRQNYKKPILALTAHAMKEEKLRCLNAGCNDHMSKPVQKFQLCQKILEITRYDTVH